MKHLQMFLGLVQDFINSGERYVTGISTVGGEYTYTYDPDTREFVAEEDLVVKFQYNDFTHRLVNSMEGKDILCAIEALEDVLAEITNATSIRQSIIDREALKPKPRVKPTPVTVLEMLENEIRDLMLKAVLGCNVLVDKYVVSYNRFNGIFTLTGCNKKVMSYNGRTGQGYHSFPEWELPKLREAVAVVMNKYN